MRGWASMIAESIKQWFEKCPLLKNGIINVNYLGQRPVSYCIECVPSAPIVKRYVDGGAVRRYVFVFASRDFYSENILNNMDTARFWEELGGWIENEKSLPRLTEGEARKIEILSSGYAYGVNVGTARFQMQLQLLYYTKG